MRAFSGPAFDTAGKPRYTWITVSWLILAPAGSLAWLAGLTEILVWFVRS